MYQKGYRADDDGNIISPFSGKPLSFYINPNGYYCMRYYSKPSKRLFTIVVHRFLGYCRYGEAIFQEGMEIRHLNGVRTDNSVGNLTFGTHSQNMMDRPKKDRKKHAEHAGSFTKKYDHEAVRKYHEEGHTYHEVMDKFGIKSTSTVHRIVKKK